MPTMPVEFSVGAFRLGHSMVREAYAWNAGFPSGCGSLDLLFFFSGTSGDLGGNPTLPSNWIADWRRLYRFAQIGHGRAQAAARRVQPGPPHRHPAGRPALGPARRAPSAARAGDEGTIRANLAFRNLTRAGMLRLASGQQMAALLRRGASRSRR